MAGERNAVATSVDTNQNDSDQSVDALIGVSKWGNTGTQAITFSFPDSGADYSYGAGTFSGAFSTVQKAAVREILDGYSAVARVTFNELSAGNANGTLRYGEFSNISTAYGYFPNSFESGGDMGYSPTLYDSPDLGSYAHTTIAHETGHAMGLEHGHEGGQGGPMKASEDSMEYSIMTYRSFEGQDLSVANFYTNKTGHYAQSLMMMDIAALQRLYGAEFSTNSGNTVYTFSTSTGAMFVNGTSQGTPAANVIFRTLWDGGGTDTYDLSNFTRDLSLDLRPGNFSDFAVGGNAQRAKLNDGWSNTTGQYVGSSAAVYADGHLYNALQYQGDSRSLIENAQAGSGNDVIIGNDAANSLYGGAGNDVINGKGGHDDLYSGSGNDTLFGCTGNDKLFAESGSNTLYGNDGIDYLSGGSGIDRLYGGAGTDFLSYANSTSGVTVRLYNNQVSGGWAAGDTISSFESVGGSNIGSDRLYGSGSNNVMGGGGGNDTFFAGSGNDQVYGGSGNDLVYGGPGNDYVAGGTGNDRLYGGTNADVFHFNSGDGADTIHDFENNIDTIEFDDFTGINTAADALAQATETGGDVLFDFGTNGTLLVENITKAQLQDDIDIV